MNKNRRTVKYLCNIIMPLCLCWSQIIQAQNPQVDFAKINEKYTAALSFFVEQEISFYPNYTTLESSDVKTSSIWKKGDSICTKVFDLEKVLTRNLSIVTDHRQKEIYLEKPDENLLNDFSHYVFSLDTLLSGCENVDFIEYEKGKVAYRFTFTFSKYKSIEVVFDRNTYLVDRIILYALLPFKSHSSDKKEPPRLEFVMKKTYFDLNLDESLFASERFVKKVAGKYIPNDIYNNYKLIDLLEY